MAAVTICSDFGAQENKICHCFPHFPFCLPWSDGTGAMIFILWMLGFKPALSLSSFIFIKKLFSSSSLSAIRVVSSAYLRLFLLAIFLPSCDSSSVTFHTMYSTYKLNKQDDNIRPHLTPFPVLNWFIFPWSVLTCFLTCMWVSQEIGKVFWYSHLF